MSDDDDTIIAPATPQGRSALAIVRIDGPSALNILTRLAPESSFEERRAVLVQLRSAGENPENIDEAIATYYPKPRSFTGNDLVELSLHGNPYLVQRVLRAGVELGARMAEPGEFTERAVLNGKLDLVQAEAVHDLIASRTALQAKLSLSNLRGELSQTAHGLRDALLDVISRLEAALDFADEGYEFIGRKEAAQRCREALRQVEELAETFARGQAAVGGLTAVIVGQPNSGKSTLLNFLCGSERAIVTEFPGTTRDLLRETLEIGGLPVTVVDTAGLRSSSDPVEEIGVGRAREEGRRAELVIYLVDAGKGLQPEDLAELAHFADPLVIYTKTDLRPPPPGELGISVVSRIGLAEFLERLDSLVRDKFAPAEGSPVIVNERQQQAVRDCGEALESAVQAIESGLNEELVVVDLYRAARALASLTGGISSDEVLDSIFSKFCIGK